MTKSLFKNQEVKSANSITINHGDAGFQNDHQLDHTKWIKLKESHTADLWQQRTGKATI